MGRKCFILKENERTENCLYLVSYPVDHLFDVKSLGQRGRFAFHNRNEIVIKGTEN